MNKFISITVFILFLMTLSGSGQKFQIPDRPLEKLVLSTDRDLYIAGETIWFASHCTAPADEETEVLSKVIYAELFAADKKVIARGKFDLEHGCSRGQLIIPPEQPTGVYFLRIYTQYLKNFHPAIWPMKTVTVVNPDVPLKSPGTKSKEIAIDIAGGELILGVPTECALRVPNRKGFTADTISLLVGDSVVQQRIPIFSNGLAYFKLTPRTGDRYSLRLEDPDGDTLLQPLPEVKRTGTCLLLDENEDRIECRILEQGQFPLTGGKDYFLTVSNNRYTNVFKGSVRAGSPVKTFRIRKDLLSAGMNYFLLTDGEKRPIDLRVLYLIPDHDDVINISGARPVYGPREPVDLLLTLGGDTTGNLAKVSVSVVKKGTYGTWSTAISHDAIEQSILLSSADMPLSIVSDSFLMQLKGLMVIYGRKLLNRPDLIAELMDDRKELLHLPEMRGITINGSVTNPHDGQAVPGSRVFLSYVGGPSQIHVNESQPDGAFIFPLMSYRPQQDLFLCTFDGKSGQEVLINSDFSNDFPAVNELYPSLDTNDRKLLEQMYINQQVTQRNTTTGDMVNYPAPRELGFGKPDISIRLADYIDLPTMEVVLNEIVPYVKVRKRKGDYRITVLDSETGLNYENHLVMVDNIPLYDVNELMQIHPANVEQVDVINRTYVIGDHTFQGIILVKTNTSNFGGITMPPDAVFISYPMITPPRNFIPVKDSSGEANLFKKPELRNVLYWAPDITLKGRKEIHFLTSDLISDYEVIVHGVTSDGRQVYGRTTLEVRDRK